MDDFIISFSFSFQSADHHDFLSGRHNWYATSHARPTYCNVCREALSGKYPFSTKLKRVSTVTKRELFFPLKLLVLASISHQSFLSFLLLLNERLVFFRHIILVVARRQKEIQSIFSGSK